MRPKAHMQNALKPEIQYPNSLDASTADPLNSGPPSLDVLNRRWQQIRVLLLQEIREQPPGG